MLMIILASMVAGSTHSPAATRAHPIRHIETVVEQPSSLSNRENAFLIALTSLLNATDRPLSKTDVLSSLNVKLSVLRDLGSNGVTYSGDNSVDGWRVEFFTVADRFNISVTFQGFRNSNQDVSVDRIGAALIAQGWTREAPIAHPFQLESFTQDCRNVRIEHDGIRAIKFELFNIC